MSFYHNGHKGIFSYCFEDAFRLEHFLYSISRMGHKGAAEAAKP